MTRLEKSFRSLKEQNPYWADMTCLAVAVRGKNYTRMDIAEVFKMVDKDEYARSEKDAILKFLAELRSLKIETNASEKLINTGVQKMELPQVEKIMA